MRRVLLSLAFVLMIAAMTSLPAIAQEATPVASPTAEELVLPPDQPVAGLSLEQLTIQAWSWANTLPVDVSPLVDETGEWCGYGQPGPVFFLPGSILSESPTRTCLVPAGMPILLPLIGANCSTVEPPPFFGADEAGLSACLTDLFAGTTITQTVTVDGVEISNEVIERYLHRTPMFSVALPENNIFDLPAGVAGIMVEGYDLLLAPLPPGEHTIVASTTIPEFDMHDAAITFHVVVAEPEILVPAASPEAVEADATPDA